MPALAARPRTTAVELTELDWRFIRDGPASGSRNMALDHALAACLREGEGVVRLYGWAHPTVSFGRNEPAAGLYRRDRADAWGIRYVRRPTGGRAVLHDAELTYAVVAPARVEGGLRAAYRRINELLADALASLEAPVGLSEGGRALPPASGPCFQSPAPGEVVAGGRKLVGSAQARLGRAFLQHGSILLGGSQTVLAALSRRTPAAGSPATLEELVGHVPIDEVTEAVAMSLRRGLGGRSSAGPYTPEEIVEADRLEEERYREEAWTWRR